MTAKVFAPGCRKGSRAFVLGPEPVQKEPFVAPLILVNLPVNDLARANAFCQAVGAVKNEQFSDHIASGMCSDTIND